MTLGEFRKATSHLADKCEVRILNDLSNLFSDVYTSRVIVVHEGLTEMGDDKTHDKNHPKVLIK